MVEWRPFLNYVTPKFWIFDGPPSLTVVETLNLPRPTEKYTQSLGAHSAVLSCDVKHGHFFYK